MAEDENTRNSPTTTWRRHRRWLLVTAVALAVLLPAGGLLAWGAYRELDGNVQSDSATQQLLAGLEAERPSRTAGASGAENILLIGSDDRTGANATYGSVGGQRSDTTILLHLAADRRHATAVGIPRDAMVSVPPCELPDGTRTGAGLIQFNQAYETGGAACAIRAVEQLSGIRIDHHLVLDFTGFKEMVNAVGGVEVCVPKAIHDRNARLDLPAGRQTLSGEQALGWVRARESLGDGSDTQRMGRQQQFLAALMRKVQSQGVLLNPARLWPVLVAATSSLKADPGLSSLGALYDLAWDLRAMPAADVVLLTAPRRPYRLDPDRDEFVQPQTSQLFAALREDRPVTVREPGAAPTDVAPGSPSNPTPGPTPGLTPGPVSGPSPGPSAGPGPTAGPTADPVFEGRRAGTDACAVH